MTDIDPVTLSVVRGRFEQIVSEMDTALVRSAFSPIIAEANDMTNGLFRADGRTIVQGDLGLPIFTGNMEYTVDAVATAFEGDICPGDVFITNDPYIGGTHLMDIKLIKPYFHDGEFLTFIATTGHWTDIGGSVPGGFSGETTDIYQEGVRIPPLKLEAGGERNDDLLELIFTNVRRPGDIEGDFKAQLNALSVGEERLSEFVTEYGLETVQAAVDDIEDRSERQMRAHLAEIPDGAYDYVDFMDNDGIEDRPLRIELEMTVDGSDVHMDFAGSAPPCTGPLNIPRSCTVSACHIAFKHLYPDIPTNAGCFEPLTVTVPEECFLDARPPRPTIGYTETSQRVLDTVFGALGKAVPEQVPGQAFSTSGAFTLSGTADGEDYVMAFPVAGGYGASASEDGLNHCTPPYARAQAPTIEVLETLYPLRFQHHSLREDSGGPGRNRGGLGTSYGIEVTADGASFSLVGDRGDHTPAGVAGGGNAAGSRYQFVIDGEDYELPLRTKVQGLALSSGDEITAKTPGGGGHGPPSQRDTERVLADVKRGYVSIHQAREKYGVAVVSSDDELEVDEGQTRELRDQN
ncbi:MAG: hydantoinase B/oxoprolinase family protein [Salinirussus sp.]